MQRCCSSSSLLLPQGADDNAVAAVLPRTAACCRARRARSLGLDLRAAARGRQAHPAQRSCPRPHAHSCSTTLPPPAKAAPCRAAASGQRQRIVMAARWIVSRAAKGVTAMERAARTAGTATAARPQSLALSPWPRPAAGGCAAPRKPLSSCSSRRRSALHRWVGACTPMPALCVLCGRCGLAGYNSSSGRAVSLFMRRVQRQQFRAAHFHPTAHVAALVTAGNGFEAPPHQRRRGLGAVGLGPHTWLPAPHLHLLAGRLRVDAAGTRCCSLSCCCCWLL